MHSLTLTNNERMSCGQTESKSVFQEGDLRTGILMASLIDPLLGNAGNDSESPNGNISERDENVILDIPEEPVNFTINSDEFKTMRWMLRFMSLWHPSTASLFERIIYPMFINVALAEMVVGNFMVNKNIMTPIFIYLYLAIDFGAYFNHVFGVFYFRCRDLDNNLINIELESEQAIKFQRSLKLLTRSSLIVYAVCVMLFISSEVAKGRAEGGVLSKYLKTFVRGSASERQFDLFAYWFNYFCSVYGIAASFSISWITFLLQKTASVRLEELERRYQVWKVSAEDAIYDHLTNYSKRIRKSCSALSGWFFTHNLILALVIPFLIYDTLEVIKNTITGVRKPVGESFIATVIYIIYWIYYGIIWAAPLFFCSAIANT